jgi:hypothetical protein
MRSVLASEVVTGEDGKCERDDGDADSDLGPEELGEIVPRRQVRLNQREFREEFNGAEPAEERDGNLLVHPEHPNGLDVQSGDGGHYHENHFRNLPVVERHVGGFRSESVNGTHL